MAKKRRRVIPVAIEPFDSYILTVLKHLTDNSGRLRVSSETIDILTELVVLPETGWTHLHTLHSAKSTKTEVVNTDLAHSEKTISKKLQDIYKDIPRSKMKTEDFMILNIAPPVTKKPRGGKIQNIPFAKVYSIGGAIVHFIVRTNEAAKRAKMDPLASVIQVKGKIVKNREDLPTDISECNLDFESTEALFEHEFSAEHAGSWFACFIRYANLSDNSKSGGWTGMLFCVIC